MMNPLKFFQEVKQETFRITWPSKKETMMGAVMVFALASIAAIFFLILDQIESFDSKDLEVVDSYEFYSRHIYSASFNIW